MKEQFKQLLTSIDNISGYNSSKGCSELNSILSKYTSVLNYFNNYNDDYKRATTVYYTDISSIRENIQQSLYANSTEKKVSAFEKAKMELRSNIDALASLIKPVEETVQGTA